MIPKGTLMQSLRSLGIATKLCLIISGILILLIITIMSIVSLNTRAVLAQEADELLNVSAARYANYIKGIFNEAFTSIRTAQLTTNATFQSSSPSERDFLNLLENMVDSNHWITFGYLYLTNEIMFEKTARSQKSILPNGDSLFIVDDIDSSSQGKLNYLNADSSLLSTYAITEALKGQQDIIFGNPIDLMLDNKSFYAVNVAAPLYNAANKVIGVIGIAIDLQQLRASLIERDRIFDNEVRILLSNEGIVVSHKNEKAIKQKLTTYNQTPKPKKFCKPSRQNNQESLIIIRSQTKATHAWRC